LTGAQENCKNTRARMFVVTVSISKKLSRASPGGGKGGGGKSRRYDGLNVLWRILKWGRINRQSREVGGDVYGGGGGLRPGI